VAAELPGRAQVVVIGGGVIGTSVAYHLTKLGLTDVVLVEQGQLSSGTTWHAAGLVGQLRASESLTRLVQYSTQLYTELEAETGLTAGYKQCGGVTVNAGDIVVADSDGVAVVPRARAQEVLDLAEQMDFKEHSMYPYIEKLKSIQEAVKKFGRL